MGVASYGRSMTSPNWRSHASHVSGKKINSGCGSEMALEIKLKKASKVYKEGDIVKGVVVVSTKSDLSHNGLTLTMEGSVNLQLSAKSVGVFEAFYNSLKPIQLVQYSIDLVKPGKIPHGNTEIPFEMPLRAKGGTSKKLYETYHGVFINIMYTLKADMKRSLLNKDLQKVSEFIVEFTSGEKIVDKPVEFTSSPDNLENVKKQMKVPSFLIRGKIDSVNCCIAHPFTGEIVVEKSSTPIRSIELQLVRVETCGCAEGFARDPTEIQNIQLADGDVCRGLPIPVYMVFPRLFTCPTLTTSNFKVEFEVNLVVIFQDDHLVTENFPITLTRE